MSKSYFERRIFGQNDQTTDESQDQTPRLGALKSSELTAPSQPYRFGASRKVTRPPISAPDDIQSTFSDPAPALAPAPEASTPPSFTPPSVEPSTWQPSGELRSRLGLSEEVGADPYAQHWGAQPERPMDAAQRAAEQERLMDEITGHQPDHQENAAHEHHAIEAEPYPLSAPQPSIPATEPSFGFHSAEDLQTQAAPQPTGEPAFQAAPVATTATHAVSPSAAPESAVTEPRMASAAAIGVSERVNLSDQRAGTSVNPEHYVATAESGDGAGMRGPSFASPPAAERPGRNPLAGAARLRANSQHGQDRGQNIGQNLGRKPAPHNRAKRGMSALPPRPPRRDRARGGFFGMIRNGMLFLVTLLGLGLLMSVSYAAFQGLRSSPEADVTVLLAPDGPIKLRPDEAGIDPNIASGRTFEADLTVLSNPRGVSEPSDDRYASDIDDAPTMTMNFGGQSLIVPQIDSAQPAVMLEPVSERPTATPISASAETAVAVVGGSGAAASTTPIVPMDGAEVSPAVAEEPLANASPLANGLNDLVLPQPRGAVPSDYQGLARTVQATTPTTSAPTSGASTTVSPTPTPTLVPEAAQVAGQRGGASSVAINPVAGLPTTPQAPALSGAAVVSPYGVQLASLRSEEQALVLWKRLQDKYPELLGGLASRVVKYDSTSRGIFYRLQAGPMPTKTTAVDFCIRLKAQGQECIFVNG